MFLVTLFFHNLSFPDFSWWWAHSHGWTLNHQWYLRISEYLCSLPIYISHLSLFFLFKLSFCFCSSLISEKEIADSPVSALPDRLFLNFAIAVTSYLCPFRCLHFQSLLLSSDYSLPFVFFLYHQLCITKHGPVINVLPLFSFVTELLPTVSNMSSKVRQSKARVKNVKSKGNKTCFYPHSASIFLQITLYFKVLWNNITDFLIIITPSIQ